MKSTMNLILAPEDVNNVCKILRISESDINRVYENPGRSANNLSYVIETKKSSYLYRIPGKGSELFSNRSIEAQAYAVLSPYKITDETLYLDANTGEKLSIYYNNSHIPKYDSEEELIESMRLLRYLHGLEVSIPQEESLFSRMEKYKFLAERFGGSSYFSSEYHRVFEIMKKYDTNENRLGQVRCFTHGDASINNLLFLEGETKPILIDMEFATMGDPLSDVATFCVDADYRANDILKLLEWYLDREATWEEKRHTLILCVTAALMWYGWAAYKIAIEEQKDPYYAFRDDYQAYIIDVLENVSLLEQSGNYCE